MPAPLRILLAFLHASAVLATQVKYMIKYRQNGLPMSKFVMSTVPDNQVENIISHMTTWSNGQYVAFQESGQLVVATTHRLAYAPPAGPVYNDMEEVIYRHLPSMYRRPAHDFRSLVKWAAVRLKGSK